MWFMKSKKAQTVGSLGPLALALGIAVIVIAVASDITSTIGAGFTANSWAANASTKGNEGLYNLAKWAPTIGIVIAAVVIIGLLMRAFAQQGQG